MGKTIGRKVMLMIGILTLLLMGLSELPISTRKKQVVLGMFDGKA